jgi:hypothetical protein
MRVWPVRILFAGLLVVSLAARDGPTTCSPRVGISNRQLSASRSRLA